MLNLTPAPSRYSFGEVHAAMQRYVDNNLLAGVSHAVLEGRELVDVGFAGWANKEKSEPLGPQHLFRVASNTKLVTSCAVLMLMDGGALGLDDPVEKFIPQLANRQVLRLGATRIDDTEPALCPISIRHLLSHSAGLSYGLLDPGSLIFKAYSAAMVHNPNTTLADLMDLLAPLPLTYQPGTAWEYSVAIDVLARVVEVASGERFDVFLQRRVFNPLGMKDTGFVIAPDSLPRLCAMYKGADLLNPMAPGLTPMDSWPYPGAFANPAPRLSGGGGLISSLPDMLSLMRSLLPSTTPEEGCLLAPATLALIYQNQLASGLNIRFAGMGVVHGKGHGLAGAVTLTPQPVDPPDSVGELQWGGIAGTHWWISPRMNLCGVLMAQRFMGFWHPHAFEFKQRVYAAVKAGR